MELLSGAYGVSRDPSGHREVAYGDPAIVAGIVFPFRNRSRYGPSRSSRDGGPSDGTFTNVPRFAILRGTTEGGGE